MKLPIYLDYHSSTPVDPEVLEAMLPHLKENFGNSKSSHFYGFKAGDAVELARKQVADLIGARPKEIVFTSCSTESCNLALKGVAEANKVHGNHIITSCVEHAAILKPCKYLEEKGFKVTYLSVSSEGYIDLNELENAITDKTILVSLMQANNEIGTINPLAKIGEICARKKVLFHTDATQGVGYLQTHVDEMNLDLLSLSAHKIYGPKGVGALYVRSKDPIIEIAPQIHGGGHERGIRSGTLNVAGIVGLGKAAELCLKKKKSEYERLKGLRNYFWEGLKEKCPGMRINGAMQNRLPHNLNVTFEGGDAESILLNARDICASTSSACNSQGRHTSHVLKAIGLSDEQIHGSVRFSLGRFSTKEQIDFAIDRLGTALK